MRYTKGYVEKDAMRIHKGTFKRGHKMRRGIDINEDLQRI